MATEEASPANPFERGPYIQVAAFCERVLTEPDGVMSLIRVVDVVTHSAHGPSAPEQMPEVRFPLDMVLVFKSGSARGRHDVTITPELPSGEPLPSLSASIRLEGEGRGAVLRSRLDMPFRMEGLYWFGVQFDGRIITRIPLEVRYSRLTTGPAIQQG